VRPALALGRLVWRPYALFVAIPVAGTAFTAWMLAFGARGGAFHGSAADAAQLARNAELELALGASLLPMALAVWISWFLFEFLRGTQAALLPALRRELFAGLLLCGAAGAALTMWWCVENPGPRAAPPFFALAFLGFASGVFCSDPVLASLGEKRWVLYALALAQIGLAPELVSAFERVPLVCVPLGLAAGVALLLAPFRRATLRARAVDPAYAPLPVRAVQRAVWKPARAPVGTADWTRAVLHDAFGVPRGGFPRLLAIGALFLGGGIVGTAFLFARMCASDWGEAASLVHAQIVGAPRDGNPSMFMLAFWLPTEVTFALLTPIRFGGAGFRPLSRARRAEVTWRATVVLAVGVVLSMGLVLWAASEIAFACAAGHAERVRGVPLFVHVLASTLVFAPVVFEARLRWLDGRKPRAYDSGRVGLVAVFLALPAIALSSLWRLWLDDWNAIAWLALMFALCALSLTLWRVSVARHFATRDLPA